MLSRLTVAVGLGLVLLTLGLAPRAPEVMARERRVTVQPVAAAPGADADGKFHFRVDRPGRVRLAYAWYAVAPDGGRVRPITYGFWVEEREPAGSLDYAGDVRAADGKLVLKDRLVRTADPVPALRSGDATHHGFDGIPSTPRTVGRVVTVGPAYRVLFAVDLVHNGRTVNTLCLAVRTADDDVALDDLADDLPRPEAKGDPGGDPAEPGDK